MTVREVIDLLETIAQKEGDQTECIVEIEEENNGKKTRPFYACKVKLYRF